MVYCNPGVCKPAYVPSLIFYKMKKFALLLPLLTMICSQSVWSRPEHGYIFAYATEKNGGRNGLHFAWSIDRVNWHPIGPEHRYLGTVRLSFQEQP
jgi:hypothetical protein